MKIKLTWIIIIIISVIRFFKMIIIIMILIIVTNSRLLGGKYMIMLIRRWSSVISSFRSIYFQIKGRQSNYLLSDYRGMAMWFGAHYNQEVRYIVQQLSVRKDPSS